MASNTGMASNTDCDTDSDTDSDSDTDTDTDTDSDTEARLTALEIKASFNEDLLDRLDAVIVRQQQQIELLLRELAGLKQQGAADAAPAFCSLRDELPPHY